MGILKGVKNFFKTDDEFVFSKKTDCMFGRIISNNGIFACPFLSNDYRGRVGSSLKNFSKSINAETEFCATCSKNNDFIFTPEVEVFKCDTSFPEAMQESEWWSVDVITCAAPNLRQIPSNMMNPEAGSKKADISYEELRVLLTGRIQKIFEVAIANGAEVLILGAFGIAGMWEAVFGDVGVAMIAILNAMRILRDFCRVHGKVSEML